MYLCGLITYTYKLRIEYNLEKLNYPCTDKIFNRLAFVRFEITENCTFNHENKIKVIREKW